MRHGLFREAWCRRVLSFRLIFSALAGAMPAAADGQLDLITNREAQCVFAGEARNVSVVFNNPGNQDFTGEIRTRIYQTSSTTAVLLTDNLWKPLYVPAGETILASAPLNFPAVRAETKFLVQWLEGTNHIIGRTEVWVYPTNLLAELKPLLADNPALGVFDPQNQLKPLLKNQKLQFTDLEDAGLDNFSGRLAIVGPFRTKVQMRDGLAKQIQALAKKGTAIVWLRPPPEKQDKLSPSFYTVLENTNAVVVVRPELVAQLPENPQSQLNLIYFCKLALNPEPLALPNLSAQP